MTTLYNLHTPFVVGFLVFVAVFVAAHLKEGPGARRGTPKGSVPGGRR
jgi:hypothetical protein